MAISRRTLILTGGRAGTSCVLGGYRFVDGQTTIQGDEKALAGVALYLGRVYKAFPIGSPELRFWQEVDDGKREHPKGAGRGSAESFSSYDGPDGDQVAPLPADHGGGSDDRDRGQTGELANGDGQPDPGHDGPSTAQARILQAVNALDPNNDEHWTAEGRPRIDAVEAALGESGVSRADVEKAAPGLLRSS